MSVERWLAIASMALFAMFAGEMASVYHFMANVPDGFGAFESFSADPKILQFISIGVAPGGVLAGVSFLMSKQYGSRPIGMMIIADGAILVAGMAACYSYVPGIDPLYMTEAVGLAPPLFMALSLPVFAFGARLLRVRERKPNLY